MTDGDSGPSGLALDMRYVTARRVLLNALTALAPFGKAFIVAGAQAVYLRTGSNDLAIAPYTTDGDLALDPTLLGDDPGLEAAMRGAGFNLWQQADRAQPGIWVAVEVIDGEDVIVPIDLIVPAAAAADGVRKRGARLGLQGNQAARTAVGLEAVLVDHDSLVIAALDPADPRTVEVEVAGVAALIVAKVHKIHDRVVGGRSDRLSDKDASDVYRIMQMASPSIVGATLASLRRDDLAGEVTETALRYIAELFGRRSGEGIAMAHRALRLATPEDQVTALCLSFVEQVIASAEAEPTT